MARDKQTELGRTPKIKDYPSGLGLTITRRFGSFDQYLQKALGKKCRLHHWTRDEMLASAKKFYSVNHRFPKNTEIREEDRSIFEAVHREFGSTNAWLEISIGTSPRIVILKIISELTPVGCDEATPAEIAREVQTQYPDMHINMVNQNIQHLRSDGFVVGGRYDRTRWWKLTNAGREFLRRFK
jgi:hypothetical protein